MKNFMQNALNVAKESGADIPVGAIIVLNGEVISSACNQREANNDISAHAEIVAMREAGKVLNNWRLDGAELYVTLEPCPMCAWAIIQSRLKAVYFASYDQQYGALGSVLDLRKNCNSNLKVYGGIMENECDNLLKTFWSEKRK